MRKLHFTELVTALNGADIVFDRICDHLDITSDIPRPEANVHYVLFDALDDGQHIYWLSLISIEKAEPILLDLIVT